MIHLLPSPSPFSGECMLLWEQRRYHRWYYHSENDNNTVPPWSQGDQAHPQEEPSKNPPQGFHFSQVTAFRNKVPYLPFLAALLLLLLMQWQFLLIKIVEFLHEKIWARLMPIPIQESPSPPVTDVLTDILSKCYISKSMWKTYILLQVSIFENI